MKYVIWNNKGGVGKSLLSFILSTEYALKNPDKNVVVLDMCPQGNVSQILLGGTKNGSKEFFEFVKNRKTIMGYFLDRVRSPYGKSGSEQNFLISPHQYNQAMPANLYLVPGDTSLDIISQSLDIFSNNTAVPGLNTWKATYSWLLDLEESIKLHHGDDTVFFIDTNPSFSNYTKMALLSADRLIVPSFSDVGSLYALNNIMYLLYDIDEVGLIKSGNSFASQTEKNGLTIPLIHMTIIGKSTIYNKQSTIAFANIETDIKTKIETMKQKYNGKIFTKSKFDTVQSIHDLNSIAPYINITGRPVGKLKPTQHAGVFHEDGREMQINGNVTDYQSRVAELIELLSA